MSPVTVTWWSAIKVLGGKVEKDKDTKLRKWLSQLTAQAQRMYSTLCTSETVACGVETRTRPSHLSARGTLSTVASAEDDL
jgi:hypothetical protein